MKRDEKYFAAANGFGGFRSYFDRIFDSENYARIYVLKGGPGTGKSSLMKKIYAAFCDRMDAERIYCSSDVSSLDGVILKSDKGAVAVLDGTAPHERDAVIPGAIDEILNLGDFWNTEALGKRKTEILDLCKKKRQSYKQAYNSLRNCSVSACYSKADFEKKTEELTSELLSELMESKSGPTELRLISSFSKDGYQTIGDPGFPIREAVSLRGDGDLAERFLSRLSARLCECGVAHLRLISPFTDERCEALYFRESQKILTTISLPLPEKATETELRVPGNVTRDEEAEWAAGLSLCEAKLRFAEASVSHFALEDIYRECMDFKAVGAMTNSLIEKIDAIL